MRKQQSSRRRSLLHLTFVTEHVPGPGAAFLPVTCSRIQVALRTDLCKDELLDVRPAYYLLTLVGARAGKFRFSMRCCYLPAPVDV